MKLRKHMLSLLVTTAAAGFLATAAIAQEDQHAQQEAEAPDGAVEIPQFDDEQAKAFIKTLTEALETDAASPQEGPRANMNTRRALSASPYITRRLADNRAVSDEQAEMIADELRALKEKYPAQADLLDREIFKVENLTIGRTAPNIQGVDTDEVSFELEDYRGKVVVIDFWGDW